MLVPNPSAPSYHDVPFGCVGLKYVQEPLFTLMKTAPPSHPLSEQRQWSKVNLALVPSGIV